MAVEKARLLGDEPNWGGGCDRTLLIQLEAGSSSGLVSFIRTGLYTF